MFSLLTNIAIRTSYRTQGLSYRSALYTASKIKFWKGRNILDLRIIIVDSFQGGEGTCVIYLNVLGTRQGLADQVVLTTTKVSLQREVEDSPIIDGTSL